MNRRQLIKWMPPAVVAVTLPKHAQATGSSGLCGLTSFNASISPSTGTITRDTELTLTVDYSTENTTDNLEISLSAESDGNPSGTMFAFELFSNAASSGSLSLKIDPLVVSLDPVKFTALDVRFIMRDTDDSGIPCIDIKEVILPMDITVD